MKKFYAFAFALALSLTFYLLLPKSTYAATSCTQHNQNCALTNCCVLSTDQCKASTTLSPPICQTKPNASAQEGDACDNTLAKPCSDSNDLCAKDALGRYTCIRNPALCQYENSTCNPKASQPCCNASDTCAKNALGNYLCTNTSTSCLNGQEPATCNTPGQQSNCCSGSICMQRSLGLSNYCQKAGISVSSCPVCPLNTQYVYTTGQCNYISSGISNNVNPTNYDCTSTDQCIPGCGCDGSCSQQQDLEKKTFPQLCNNGTSCNTAVGPISTSAEGLIIKLFGLILSLSGGIALILIIISGYRLMTSQGNPEGIKGAREQLTAAIVGLLFIIFSLVILQIIGYNILHIPGFS